jgi:hypothetical protein
MRRHLSLLLVPALALGLVACSDDDDEPSDDTTAETGDDTTTPEGTGSNVDTEELTQQLEEAILGEGAESNWEVTQVTDDEIVISPKAGAPEVTEDDANTVCAAVTTVALSVLPTAVVTITDADGTPIITSEGAEGCHPVGE